MIKIKNLQNIQDTDCITFDRLNDLIPEINNHVPNQIKSTKGMSFNHLKKQSNHYRSQSNNQKTPQYNIKNSQNNIKNLQYNMKNCSQQQNNNSINTNSSFLQQKRFDSNQNSKIDLDQTNLVQLCFNKTRRRKRKIRQNGAYLKQIVTDQKIKFIVYNFISKLRRNNVNSFPVDYTPFQNDLDVSYLDKQGFELNQLIFIGIATLSVIQIIILSIIYTLSIVFPQVNDSPIVAAFQTFSLAFYILEILINFVTVRLQQGKRISTFRQIWKCYIKDNFIFDIISVVILMVDLYGHLSATLYLRLFIIVKLSQGLVKIEKLEIFFINNFYNEQYWSLIKVFLFNYCFAHILAIFLVAMASIDDQNNWMITKEITNQPWYEKYAWSYYWATTTMLTVGFGDLSATTYKEAIIMVFIQTISCMALAYNINCIGTLINNIRSQDLQKSKNFKVFRKLARKNNVSEDLEWRINNYIQQSSNIKKNRLPKGLRVQFLKQSNKKIFQNLPFFKNLMQRTLFSFAQKIQMHICHPEQILQHIDDRHNLMILKGGSIGFSCKKPGCDYNSTVIDILRVSQNQQPILISLGFIRQNRPIYEIRSLKYSILYFLEEQSIISVLKGSEMDYELYCLLRDKCSHIPDEYQLFDCELCSGKHTKFVCPKIHFIPYKQHVTNKYLHLFRTGKNRRQVYIQRVSSSKMNTLKTYQYLNMIQTKKSDFLVEDQISQKKVELLFSTKTKYYEQVDNQYHALIKQIQQMKEFFSKNTAQLIKNQFNRIMFNGQGYDDVWIIETDRIRNYKNYFQTDNSYHLSKKFSLNKRKKGIIYEDILSEIKSKRMVTNSTNNINNKQSKRSINSFHALINGQSK